MFVRLTIFYFAILHALADNKLGFEQKIEKDKDIASRTLELPALGRPFGAGDLYDARTDKIFSSATFWSSQMLEVSESNDKLFVEEFPYSEIYLNSKTSVEDKLSNIDVMASISLDIAQGKIKISGSAGYLQTEKVSTNTAEVGLMINKQTHTVSLTMAHLRNTSAYGNVKKWIENKGSGKEKKPPRATHIVTRVLYGGNAVFNFYLHGKDNDQRKKIEGSLKVIISVGVGGGGAEARGRVSSDDKKTIETVRCSYYGDIKPSINPTTYNDATEIAKTLEITKETAVPLKVWLLPLNIFETAAGQLLREIKADILKQLMKLFQNFNDVDSELTDLLQTSTAKAMPTLTKHIKKMKQVVYEIRIVVQRQLGPFKEFGDVGNEGAKKLQKLIKQITGDSLYSYEKMKKWIDMKKRECRALEDLFNYDLFLATIPGYYDKLVFNSTIEFTVVLHFEFYLEKDPFVDLLIHSTINITRHGFDKGLEEANQYFTNENSFFVSWVGQSKLYGRLYWASQLFKGMASKRQFKQEYIKIAVVEEPITENEFNLTLEVHHYGDQILSTEIGLTEGQIVEILIQDDDEASAHDRWITTNYITWTKYNLILIRCTEPLFQGIYGLIEENEQHTNATNTTKFADDLPQTATWIKLHPIKKEKDGTNYPTVILRKLELSWTIGCEGNSTSATSYQLRAKYNETFPNNPYLWSNEYTIQMVQVGHNRRIG